MRHIEINKEWNSRQPFVGEMIKEPAYTAHDVLDSFYEGRYLVTKDKRTGGWGHFIIPRNEQE